MEHFMEYNGKPVQSVKKVVKLCDLDLSEGSVTQTPCATRRRLG
jgi:hypothetical protein